MQNKFKKGLILGGILAVGAAVGFALTKGGHELTDDLEKDLKTLAKHLKKNLSKLHDVTKDSFDDLVTGVVEDFAKTKDLSLENKNKFIKALKAKWEEMEEEYEADKEDEEKHKK